MIDLMTHLSHKYEDSAPDQGSRSVNGFLDFAKNYLSNNLPRNTFSTSAGFGFVMPDGTHVSFAERQQDRAFDMRNSGIGVGVVGGGYAGQFSMGGDEGISVFQPKR